MNKITRKQAKESGLKRYFTCLPCKSGHTSERFTVSGNCVECNKLKCSKWQKDNRKSRSKYYKEWYHRDLDKRRRVLRERRKNPEILAVHNERNAEWRRNNPDYFREWSKNNPDKSKSCQKASKNRRRALERNAEGCHSPEDIRRIYSLQNGKCAYCKRELDYIYQLDHIVPLSKGGSNYPNNIQLLCDTIDGSLSCNQKKRDKDPIVFAQSLGLLL